MHRLFKVYPEIAERIDALCGGAAWGVTGASAILHDGEGRFYFGLAKPKHWARRQDGVWEVGLGAIGGSLEPGETPLLCLEREVHEEIGADVAPESSELCYLVYAQRLVEPLALEERALARPTLFAIDDNLYRQEALPDYDVLTIVTFMARLLEPPGLGDLFGLLSVPWEGLRTLLASPEITLSCAKGVTGLELHTRDALPTPSVLTPIWTVRSLQLAMGAGSLQNPPF